MDPSSCPPDAELRQLLDGAVAEAAQAALVRHLDTCSACRERLEELAGTGDVHFAPTLLLGLATPRTKPLEEVLHTFKVDTQLTLAAGPDTPPAVTWIHRFLPPASSAEFLGRLDAYDVTAVLGQGGMGVVLKAFDPALKRWVALKVLSPHLASDTVSRQRFAREGQAVAAIKHANVVAVHAVREVKDLPFIVMEYLDGGSLEHYVQEHGPLDWRTAAEFGIQIASGLAAAHAANLVHRDIKPSNVLLATTPWREAAASNATHLPPTPLAKISDFGLAHLAHEARLTHSGMVTGTPMYMAPEQALGEELDARADLFSLGSVLYTLCTGKEPYPSGGALAVLRQVCETTPPSIRESNPDVPASLATIVERLQAKRPEDRPAGAAEVVAALTACLEHPDRPTGIGQPVSRARRPRSHRVLRWTLLAAVLVSFLALAWFFRAAWQQSNSLTDSRIALRSTLTGHDGPVWAVAFAPNGQTLATGSDDGTLRLWGPTDARQLAVLPAHRGAVYSLAFAHDGKAIATGGGDGRLKLWSVADRKETATYPHNAGIRRLAFAPDDATVAVVRTNQNVELWDIAAGKKRATLTGHGATVFDVAFAPDGQTLATGDFGGIIKLWDPKTGTERASFRGDPLGMRALAFAPDSATLAATGTGDPDVTIWNVATQKPVAVLHGPEHVQAIAIAPDGVHLATASRRGVIRLWDVESRSIVATFSGHRGNVFALAFSPDGQSLATAGEDRLVKLWDLTGLNWSEE